jgi:predicted MFS family arabinose efflux permease
MPVSLLTPIAEDLAITEGQAGMAIAVSGFFAVVTSLFSNGLLARLDRRAVVLGYTAVLGLSGIAVALAPNYPMLQGGTALAAVIAAAAWKLPRRADRLARRLLHSGPGRHRRFVWQALVLPRTPDGGTANTGAPLRLLANRTFALGMAAMTLFFAGQFALSTYLRPFLEVVTGLDVNTLRWCCSGSALPGWPGPR